MKIVALVLSSAGLVLSILAFAMVVRRRRDAVDLASAIRTLRERYGLDRHRIASSARAKPTKDPQSCKITGTPGLCRTAAVNLATDRTANKRLVS